MEFRSGLGTRAEIADVAGIFAVGEDREAEFAGDGEKLGKEFVLAEVAAVQWVGTVVWVVELGGGDDADRKLELSGDSEGFG